MKKTVALMGSPRVGGNTDILLDKALEGLKSEAGDEDVIEKIMMADYQGYVCQGCGRCRETQKCEVSDKVNVPLEKIKEADGIIIGTPTWWMAPSSQLKIFMDHWGGFIAPDYSSRISGKKAIILACNGNAEVNFAEQVCKDIGNMLVFLKVEVKGSLGVKGLIEKGDASKNSEMLDKAFSLGKSLYNA